MNRTVTVTMMMLYSQGTVVFQCGDAAMGRCIPMDNVCDNKQHCPDYSDETSDVCDPFCELASKRGLRFYCDVKVGLNNTIVSKCMSTNVKCDGKVQCTGTADDADDESQCSEGVSYCNRAGLKGNYTRFYNDSQLFEKSFTHVKKGDNY